jgi:hypothetical protein
VLEVEREEVTRQLHGVPHHEGAALLRPRDHLVRAPLLHHQVRLGQERRQTAPQRHESRSPEVPNKGDERNKVACAARTWIGIYGSGRRARREQGLRLSIRVEGGWGICGSRRRAKKTLESREADVIRGWRRLHQEEADAIHGWRESSEWA